jgi:hypothetical protein
MGRQHFVVVGPRASSFGTNGAGRWNVLPLVLSLRQNGNKVDIVRIVIAIGTGPSGATFLWRLSFAFASLLDALRWSAVLLGSLPSGIFSGKISRSVPSG